MAIGVGCAETTHHATTTETVQNSNGTGTNTTVTNTTPVSQNSTSSTSTTTTTQNHQGAIGTVFHAIGAVLAFPFILIGNIIQAIF